MSKFAIDPGHGCYPDTGAEGYLNEQDCALEISNLVISKLQNLGHEAWNIRPSSASSINNSLQQRCDASATADYLISIHLNAGEGEGSEVFAISDAGATLASKVLNELVSLGFTDREVKSGRNLYVLRHSDPVAILIEICFVDTQSDADLYNSLGADAIATAIVQGVTGQKVSSSSSKYDCDFIKSIQHDLQRVSCLGSGEGNATGNVTDKVTKDAIKQFRYIVGLPDGERIDNTLVSALNSIIRKPTVGAGWASNPIATRFIQWFIGINKTGIFDNNTTEKVKQWQVKAGIWSASGADGVIREKDWNKILK